MSVLRRHPDLVGAASAALLSVAGAVIALQLWRADSAIPLAYIGDSHFFLATIKATVEHGWFLGNPDLGYPLGSDWQDFPVLAGDTLHLLVVRFLSLFSSNPVTVLHLFYVLGYALTAVSAFYALRWLEVSRGPAIVCATLFSLLPYHFFLGEAHPFHSSYWVVPIAGVLVLALLLDRPLLARREGASGPLAYASRTSFLTLGACVLIGSAGSIYYSLFAVGLVIVAGLLAAIRWDWRRSLASAGVVAATLLAVVALNGLPTLLYEAENGANESVAERTPDESERYSLTLFGLLAPADGHRIGAFDSLRDDYVATSPFELAPVPGVGLVAALGFVWLIAFALASVLRPGEWVERWRLQGAAAAAALVSFLIATTGGLSLMFAHLVSPQLRVWARMHVFIAFFALVAVAALLDLALRHPAVRRRGKSAAAALLSAVLLIGFFDQTNLVPAYDETRREFESDAAFVAEVEETLGPGAAVFQLPYQPFPEWYPAGGTLSFDPFRGYLHSTDIRWSYAAMYGRGEDWQPGVIDESADQLLARLSAAGFDGLVVDRFAYPDRGGALEAEIADAAKTEPVASADGRFSFFDLRPRAEELARSTTPSELEDLRDTTLAPLVADPGAGLTRARTKPLGNYSPDFEMAGPAAQVVVTNPSDHDRRAVVEVGLPPEATSAIELPHPIDTGFGPIRVRPGEVSRRKLLLAPGANEVSISADGDVGPGTLDVRVYDALGELRPSPDDVQVQD